MPRAYRRELRFTPEDSASKAALSVMAARPPNLRSKGRFGGLPIRFHGRDWRGDCRKWESIPRWCPPLASVIPHIGSTPASTKFTTPASATTNQREEIWPTVQRFLDERAARSNWYLHLNFWDPHTSYRVPADFGDPFKSAPLPKWLDDAELIRRHNRVTGPHTSLDIAMWDDQEDPRLPRQPGKVVDLSSMRRMIDGYDTGVLYADHFIGLLIEQLKGAEGVCRDTAIIVSTRSWRESGRAWHLC